MKTLKFPQDEKLHDSIIEWWYFNGHLKSEDGNAYTFMDCLFKAKTKAVKIPFLSNLPKKIIYFSHSILSDIKNQKNYPVIDYLSMISKDSWTKPLLFVNYINPLIVGGYVNSAIEQTDLNQYRIKTENLDLNLTSIKQPLTEGGSGFLKLGNTKSTFYYSLTNLKTEGVIKVRDKWIKVTGKSWMDHQWADVSYTKDYWTWFSIQLENNIELVCFEYREKDNKTYLASISNQNDQQEHFKAVKLTPIGQAWKSKKTKAIYYLSWRIEVPAKNIDLVVKPLVEDQEIIFGTINYWEGPISVEGKFNNQSVKGQGFIELVGRHSQYGNLKFIREEISNRMKNIYTDLKKINHF